jgi:hypothetical protein
MAGSMRNFIILTCLVIFTGCSQQTEPQEIIAGWTSVPYSKPLDPEREIRELELRELIFRNEIADPIRDEIVYLSFGYADDENWIEPPNGFIERFGDLEVVVRSVADANLLYGGFTSKTDDRIGHIYYVQILEWIDENTVKLNHA